MESTGFEVKLLSYVTLCNPMDCSLLTRPLCPWNSSGKTTRVACHFLLQGIFPTRGSNLGLPHCRQTLCPLSHQGSPTGFMVGLLVRAPRRLTPRLTSQDCCYQCPHPRSRLLLTHTSTGDPQTLSGWAGSIACGITAPFPWVLVHTRFCAFQKSVSPCPVKVLKSDPTSPMIMFTCLPTYCKVLSFCLI